MKDSPTISMQPLREKYASVGYRKGKIVCLFCLQLDADFENLGTLPPTQGIQYNHIVIHRKSKKFWHVGHKEIRPSIFRTRSYYSCTKHDGGCFWLNEEDIRPVNEKEGDAAMGWIMACGIKQALDDDSD